MSNKDDKDAVEKAKVASATPENTDKKVETEAKKPAIEKNDGAGGLKATENNQSLKKVATAGTPNSPDSTTRDVPADASAGAAAKLSKSPPDNKEENYPDDEHGSDPHDPYEEIDAEAEKQIEKELDAIDEREEAAAKQQGYMSKNRGMPRKTSPVDRYLLQNQSKPDETPVYGYGGIIVTLGDLRHKTGKAAALSEKLLAKGKKKNFFVASGLTLGDIT